MRYDTHCLDGFIGGSQINLQTLFDMGKAALWANNGDDEDSAVEAALLWQAMFINLESADIESMNIVLQHIVKEVIQKLGTMSPKH